MARRAVSTDARRSKDALVPRAWSHGVRAHFEVRGAVPALDPGTPPRSSLDGVVPSSSDRAVPFERAAGRLTQAKLAYFALKTSKAAEGDLGGSS